jgi:nucleotide-binding universal stress UspA family protein
MSSVLLCIDASPAASAATRVAVTAARELNLRLCALYVIEDSGLATRVNRARDGHGTQAEQLQTSEALSARLRTMAANEGVQTEWFVDKGEPFERILEHARALQPTFIVMGRAGRRGPGRALLGSQVEHVLEFTEWPVIVVPAPLRNSPAGSS